MTDEELLRLGRITQQVEALAILLDAQATALAGLLADIHASRARQAKAEVEAAVAAQDGPQECRHERLRELPTMGSGTCQFLCLDCSEVIADG